MDVDVRWGGESAEQFLSFGTEYRPGESANVEAIIGSIPKLWDERGANAGSLTFVQRLKGRVMWIRVRDF